MVREVDTAQETDALLLAGDVQEQLHDSKAVLGQIALPVVDLAVAPLPHVVLPRGRRQLLAIQGLGMYPNHEHLLIVGAVEDPDLAARRQVGGVAPQVVVVELLRRRNLEAAHGDTLWVHAAHHVADRPVLARRVERLQHDQHAPRVLGGQAGLILGEQAHPLFEQRDALLLLLYARLERGVEVLREGDG